MPLPATSRPGRMGPPVSRGPARRCDGAPVFLHDAPGGLATIEAMQTDTGSARGRGAGVRGQVARALAACGGRRAPARLPARCHAEAGHSGPQACTARGMTGER